MTRSESKEIAKQILMESLATAYYKLENTKFQHYSVEEIESIIANINKYGKTMGKAINKEYFTF